MYAIRRFAVRHSRAFEAFYQGFERIIVKLDPVFRWIGYEQLEKPVALTERLVKGVLFDCKMCGQCVLSSTGMSCPMNCPKQLRNGPCGGVRAGGFCEVKPAMKCVWVDAWDGAREKAALGGPEQPVTDAGKQAVASAFARARAQEPASAPLGVEPKGATAATAGGQHTSVLTTPERSLTPADSKGPEPIADSIAGSTP
jgi:Methylene-tetrahydrofolate reductase C terminal